MTNSVLRLGTRGSSLALYQARWVADRLRAAWPDLTVILHPITTGGDRTSAAWRAAARRSPSTEVQRQGSAGVPWQDAVRAVADTEGRGSPAGAFTEDLEQALLAGEIDLAVHSLKDLPAEMSPDLVLAAFPQRAEARDALIMPANNLPRQADDAGAKQSWQSVLSSLPPGARVGTGSLRRHLQMAAVRPDLQPVPLRGNVEQRLALLDAGRCDLLVLAAAGLQRLGLSHRITALIDEETMVPAPGQGVLAVQARAADEAVLPVLRPLQKPDLQQAVRAELAFLKEGEGDNRLPVGALCVATPTGYRLHGFYAQPSNDDPARWLCAWGRLPWTEANGPASVGIALARRLRQEAVAGHGTTVSLAVDATK